MCWLSARHHRNPAAQERYSYCSGFPTNLVFPIPTFERGRGLNGSVYSLPKRIAKRDMDMMKCVGQLTCWSVRSLVNLTMAANQLRDGRDLQGIRNTASLDEEIGIRTATLRSGKTSDRRGQQLRRRPSGTTNPYPAFQRGARLLPELTPGKLDRKTRARSPAAGRYGSTIAIADNAVSVVNGQLIFLRNRID